MYLGEKIYKHHRTNYTQTAIVFKLADVSRTEVVEAVDHGEVSLRLFRILVVADDNVSPTQQNLTTWERTVARRVVSCKQ